MESSFYDLLTSVKLKIRIPQYTHFRTIETFDLGLFRDANRRNYIADFKPYIRHDKAEDRHCTGVDQLHDKLREVTIEQTAHAVGAVGFDHAVAHHTVPTSAVLPRGKYTDRN